MLRGFASGAIPVNVIAAQLSSSQQTAAPRSLLRQVVRFGAIGAASTLAYIALFMLLQGDIGAQLANLIALLLTAIGNTAANRRFTFGVRSREGAGRAQLQGLVLWLIMSAATALALFLLLRANPHASHTAQSVVQLIGNVIATIIRFVMLRRWFAPKPAVAVQD